MRCPACDHDNIPGADLCDHCGLDLAGLDVEAWGVDPDDPLLVRKLEGLSLKQPLVLGAAATVHEAIELMRRRHEGCVFVCDPDGSVAGIVTEHDVTARVANRGRDPRQTRLQEVMTANPVTLEAAAPLAWALHRMGVDGQRHLAVLREGALVGLLSARTVLEILLERK